MKQQTPTIGIGTELSIGTVTGFTHEQVILDYNGNRVSASFKAVERAYEDDQKRSA